MRDISGTRAFSGKTCAPRRKFFSPPALSPGMEATLTRHRFRAMGTDVELLVEAADAARCVAAAEAEFHRLEAVLTRFRPESELSRLNAAGSLAAGPDLLRVVE